MANKRMFSKSITNSSAFLKMPATSRLLYYDLGMNADDDGFVEHFMVLRMTGATQQDLGVLELNGLVKVFDENVLWIKDWKENNYIRNDRYTPSKYLSIYSLDTIGIPVGIPEVDTGKVSIELDKNSIKDNNIIICSQSPKIGKTLNVYEQEFEELWKLYPKKQGKKDALKHYIKARKEYDFEVIKKGLNNYNSYIKRHNMTDQYIKNGSTWFNQECWNDEYDAESNNEPYWLNQDIKEEKIMTQEEQKEMNNLFKEFN